MDREEGQLTINRTFARAFINFLTQTVEVEMNPLFQIDIKSGMRFSAINQAHRSVLQDLADLVTSKDEVLSEYDRLLTKLKTLQPNSGMAIALESGRKHLEKMLDQGTNH